MTGASSASLTLLRRNSFNSVKLVKPVNASASRQRQPEPPNCRLRNVLLLVVLVVLLLLLPNSVALVLDFVLLVKLLSQRPQLLSNACRPALLSPLQPRRDSCCSCRQRVPMNAAVASST
jgi:hypothetical protein